MAQERDKEREREGERERREGIRGLIRFFNPAAFFRSFSRQLYVSDVWKDYKQTLKRKQHGNVKILSSYQDMPIFYIS